MTKRQGALVCDQEVAGPRADIASLLVATRSRWCRGLCTDMEAMQSAQKEQTHSRHTLRVYSSIGDTWLTSPSV